MAAVWTHVLGTRTQVLTKDVLAWTIALQRKSAE
jgi:hypothetical protein